MSYWDYLNKPRQSRHDNPLIKVMQNPIGKLFNSIAPKYDLINDLLSFGIHRKWLKKAVRKIPIANDFKILDLATGTGNFAFEFFKVNRNIKVFGIDIAENMLEIARQKNKKWNFDIEFKYGDATNIPFPENFFDVVSISYGIRNVTDIYKCFSEVHRVLKPNGYFVIVEFGLPKNFFRKIFELYQKLIIVKIGGLISKNVSAYTYFVESVKSFPSGENFAQIIKDTNLFGSIKFYPLTLGIAYIYVCQAKKSD